MVGLTLELRPWDQRDWRQVYEEPGGPWHGLRSLARNAWGHEPRPWSCLGNVYWNLSRVPANTSNSDSRSSCIRGGHKKPETGQQETLGSPRHQLTSLSSKNHYRLKFNVNVHEFFWNTSHLKNRTEHIPWKFRRRHHHDWHSQVHSTSR